MSWRRQVSHLIRVKVKHSQVLGPYVVTSDNAVTFGNENLRMERIVSEWYALNPDIRRLWVYEAGKPDPDDARGIHVIVALAPVCDSDDISPIWLARCT